MAGALTTLYLASNVLQHFRLFIGTTDLNSNVRIRSAVAGLNLRFDFHVSGKAGILNYLEIKSSMHTVNIGKSIRYAAFNR